MEKDIRLLVHNAKMFNEPNSVVYTDADSILVLLLILS